MKNRAILFILFGMSVRLGAQTYFSDTTFVAQQQLEDVVVTSLKVNTELAEQPLSASEIRLTDARRGELVQMKDISATVPNFFMPDYGSSLTSAIYVRGVGSRINTPAVALYVDDVPYVDKSAFSFDFVDVERIEVLRGPQGTLYGRNAMGGLLNVKTVNPFRAVGTKLRVSGEAQQGKFALFASHGRKLSERVAIVGESFFASANGYFHNDFLHQQVDDYQRYGGRVRISFLPQAETKIDFSVNYEHTDEGGYAYEYQGVVAGDETSPECVGRIQSNREAGYWRSLVGCGLRLLHQTNDLVISSVTGFQLLNDCMRLDQDFLPSDTFELDQSQRLRVLTEEVVLKRRDKSAAWQWTTGFFGYAQQLVTDCPVSFCRAGVGMIQGFMDKAMQEAQAPVRVRLTSPEMVVETEAETPILGLALYHQSSLAIGERWNLSLGLRLDYEKLWIDYDTEAKMAFEMKMPGSEQLTKGYMPVEYEGESATSYLRLLPKFSVLYKINDTSNIYLTLSKGQRSGGYNVQTFSDIVSASFRAKPETAKLTDTEVENVIAYKPESCWNYELGAHLQPLQWLKTDMALFFMDVSDLQVAKFSEGGLGRRNVNAGSSASVGGEFSAVAELLQDRLVMTANYGYVKSFFRDYETLVNGEAVDYKDNRVPFVPEQTFSFSLDGVLCRCEKGFVKELSLGADVQAQGTIYWTEDNVASQNAFAQIGARANLNFGKVQLNIWAKNLTDTEFSTFYFESLNHRFAQRGKPRRIGADLVWRF